MTQSSRVLATRCPHCHTVFRVVADQLKLRDGLVRCGHCREVFDGRAYLCDPPADDESGSTPDMSPDATGAPAPTAAEAPRAENREPDVVASESASGAAPNSPFPAPVAVASASGDAPPGDRADRASAGKPPVPEMLTPTAIAALLGAPDESRAQMRHGPGRYIDDEDATALTAPTATATTKPAQRVDASATTNRARPQTPRPGVARMIWRTAMALAVAAMLAQWAWLERAALVDRMPALRGVFAVIGRPLHVSIAPPRQPDMIQISSVTLVTDPDAGRDSATGAAGDSANLPGNIAANDGTASGAFAPADGTVSMTLTVFMRNQASYAVAWPSLELTLSDIDGQPVVRRVFSANDYVSDGAQREAGLSPRNERTIRLRLSAQAALASNYRVLAFYP